MPPGLRRFAWGSFLLTEILLVAAATAYVGLGTREFWLVVAAALLAWGAYVVAVRATAEPTRGEVSRAPQRWYWF